VTAPRVLVAAEQLRRRVPGGIGRTTTELLRAIPADAVDVTVWVSRRPWRALGPDPVMALGHEVRQSHLTHRSLIAAWDMGLAAPPGGFDVVHAVSLATPPLRSGRAPVEPTWRSSSATTAARKPALTVAVHDVTWRDFPDATTRRGRRWHEAALRRAVARADRLIVPSPEIAREVLDAGVDDGRVSVIPWGSDHLEPPDDATTTELLRRHGVNGPFLLTVGTLEPRKNLSRLVSAYRQARESLPEPWPLVIVGPSGWGPDRRGAVVGAVPGVVVLGRVSEVVLSGLYRRAQALLYFALGEGFGLPPAEANSVGLPCAASRTVPSVADAAWPEPVAVLADPRNVDAMAGAVVEAATNEARRQQLVRAGRALAATRTWKHVGASYAALWRELR
jgi:glycosyltransferase involved in cell wall biosynthesis